MTDDRFVSGPTPLSLNEVGQLVGGEVRGPGDTTVTGISSLADAEPGELGFLGHPRYVGAAGSTRAGALLVAEAFVSAIPADTPAVVVGDGYRALHAVADHFSARPEAPSEVHPTAVLGRGVELGEGVAIGPYVVLEDGVRIGADTSVAAHCVVGAGAVVGDACRLHPHVVLYPGVTVGSRVTIHAGARIGSDGFGFVEIDGVQEKIPHSGGCDVGDDVEIGANSTIDRGSIGRTRIGNGVKLDNLVHVAHNVSIGDGSLLAAQVGIAGSTSIGRRVWMGGQSGAINQVAIGDDVRVVVQTGITRDVPAGETVSGFPARPHREELRLQALVRRLPRLARRLGLLEADRTGRSPQDG